MQIHVRCSCGEGSCPEWAVVDLQGVVVESQPSIADGLSSFPIGLLCRSSSQESSYTFTVGYHELSGTKMPLKKPLLVMKKKKATEGEGSELAGSPTQELEVVGIIRHRILFKNRPKALITSK